MKKLSLLFIAAIGIISANAQLVITKELKKGITLLMPRTADDEKPGSRGAGVVWHPLQKKYYASMAGNIGFPMGIFDATGEILSSDTLNTNADTRGLWYNVQKKVLQGNQYSDYGWFQYSLNLNGLPVKTTVILEGKNQPDDHSVGAYNPLKQEVLFLFGDEVLFYSLQGIENGKPLTIHWGISKNAKEPANEDETWTAQDYNYTTVVYTGIKGAELGFVNNTYAQIELYNIADGYLTRKLTLPTDAPVNATFNFAYTNGMFWLFNMEERTWTSYK